MTISIESLTDAVRIELAHLGERHCEECEVRFDPQWDVIRAMIDGGVGTLVTARDHSELVGYCFLVTVRNPFTADVEAHQLALYIHPEYRGSESYRFLREIEDLVDADEIQMSARGPRASDIGCFFASAGYSPREQIYIKEL